MSKLTPTLNTFGLTGGIASGKSLACDYFEKLGAVIIDTDQAARECVLPNSSALTQIADKFGPSMILEDGSLNRKALRAIIFSDPDKKKWLEELLHPLIRKRVNEQLEAVPDNTYAIIAIPLLVENQSNYQWLNGIIVVDTSEELQLSRLIARDGSDRQEAQAIINAQSSREDRINIADYVIENNGSTDHLKQQVEQVHQSIMEVSKGTIID